MTPTQQNALEALAGRALTDDELAHAQARNDADLAASLSVGLETTQPTPIGIGTVLAVMAPSGGDFLNALEGMGAADANVKWALKMIEQGTFDVGHPVTRAQLQGFAATVPDMAPGITALLAVAAVPDPVPVDAVSAILNNEG